MSGANYIKNKQNNVFTIIGSWNDHYNSWSKTSANLLLIKYEDLLSDPFKELNRIIIFLKKFMTFMYDDYKIQNIISSTSFERMQKMENDEGFFEMPFKESDQDKVKFFNKGRKNDWRKYLDKNKSDIIENKFEKEMKELGYI